MGWFTPKCPQCGGPLQATGACAPYPSYRCEACISDRRRDAEIEALRAELVSLKPDHAQEAV